MQRDIRIHSEQIHLRCLEQQTARSFRQTLLRAYSFQTLIGLLQSFLPRLQLGDQIVLGNSYQTHHLQYEERRLCMVERMLRH